MLEMSSFLLVLAFLVELRPGSRGAGEPSTPVASGGRRDARESRPTIWAPGQGGPTRLRLRGSHAPERGFIPGKKRCDGSILDAGSIVGTIVYVGV